MVYANCIFILLDNTWILKRLNMPKGVCRFSYQGFFLRSPMKCSLFYKLQKSTKNHIKPIFVFIFMKLPLNLKGSFPYTPHAIWRATNRAIVAGVCHEDQIIELSISIKQSCSAAEHTNRDKTLTWKASLNPSMPALLFLWGNASKTSDMILTWLSYGDRMCRNKANE